MAMPNESKSIKCSKKAVFMIRESDATHGITLADALFNMGYELYAPCNIAHIFNRNVIPTNVLTNKNIEFDCVVDYDESGAIKLNSMEHILRIDNMFKHQEAIA